MEFLDGSVGENRVEDSCIFTLANAILGDTFSCIGIIQPAVLC